MKVWLWLLLALASFGIARGARTIAQASRQDILDEPYTPTTRTAPYVVLAYREAAADMLFVRLRGYFGDPESTVSSIADQCEAIISLDPRFYGVYEYCGNAMSFAGRHVPQSVFLRAIALLERGTHEFPRDWRIPMLAGEIYTQDLQTDDPRERREWDERGILLVESAIRKPGAPAQLADWAAVMRTKYGQHERAIAGLREMLLLTTDTRARRTLIDRLAKLQKENADEIASELFEVQRDFNVRWQASRPTIPPTWYVLLGDRISPWFDMTDLATGGHDLVTSQPHEKLEPLQ